MILNSNNLIILFLRFSEESLLKVKIKILFGVVKLSTRYLTLHKIVVVFPEPAPAKILIFWFGLLVTTVYWSSSKLISWSSKINIFFNSIDMFKSFF